MKRKIRLYGRLRKQFGPEFELDVETPVDAIRAMCILVPDFQQELAQGHYKFVRGNRQTGLQMPMEALHLGLGNVKELHLIPTAPAAGRGFGKILFGALLIGVAFATGGASIAASGGLLGTGLSLGVVGSFGLSIMLGGVASLLTPKPKLNKPKDVDRNESFLFNGPANTAQQGVAVPIIYGEVFAGSVVISAGLEVEQILTGGYYNYSPGFPGEFDDYYGGDLYSGVNARKGGKGSGGASAGQEAPNNLQSNSTARIIDMISEGPIVGLSDSASPLKSVYLDEVPLQNSDGTFNFKGLAMEQRLGNPSDEPMPGFSATESEINVGVKCTTVTPLVRSINSATVDEVRLTVAVQSLFKIDTKDGAIGPSSVDFAFDLQSSGGTYTEVLRESIVGKTNTTYQRAYRLPLTGTGPWNIRMRRLTPDSTESKLQNDIFWSSYTEIVDAKMMYPNCALIGINADARQFGSRIPNRAYKVKGRIISVPTNYNPTTRTYATSGPGTTNGVWDGTFKQAWTNNPAWILYDLVTHPRYGLGNEIPGEYPNKWALYEIGQYCDGLVPDGLGGLEPRYTINTQIVDRGEAWDLLSSIVSVFRGMFYWGSGSLEFTYDHDESPRKLVTRANVIDGKINYSSGNYRTRHSVAVVTWNDPEIIGRVNFEYVQDPDLLERYGHKPLETTAWGCTSRGQAYRVGKWLLETQKNDEVVSYGAGLDHADVRPGMIIEISDPEYTSQRMAGRTVSGSTATAIRIDSPINFGGNTTGGQLRVILPNGAVEQRAINFTVTPSNASTDTLTVTTPFSQVPLDGAIWSVSLASVTPRLFTVVGVEESDDMTFTVTAVRHDPNKFARVEQNINLPPNTFSDIPSGMLESPPALTFKEFLFQEGTASMPGVLISWPSAPDPRVTYYQWQIKRDDEDWGAFNDTARLSEEVRNIKPGVYSARVRSANYLGAKSAWRLVENVTLEGGSQFVSNVVGLVKVRNDAALTTVLRWTKPVDPDGRPLTTEIVYNSTNDLPTATTLGRTDTTEFPISRTGFYWVRHAFSNVVLGAYSGIEITAGDLPSGASAVNGYLTNESHTVATLGDGSGGSYAAAGGTFRVALGLSDITTGNGVTYAKAAGAPAWITINATTGVYTVTDPGVDSATAVLEATYGSLVIQKVYSITKSKQGVTGPRLALVADNQAFTFTDGAANPTSQTITLTALLNNLSGTAAWSTTPSVTLGGTGNTRTLSVANFGANRQVTVEATLGGITDRITIVRLERDVSAPANANRVPLSRMEGDAGWNAFSNSPSGASVSYFTFEGRRAAFASASASAAGQFINIACNPPNQGVFPVVPGERLSVQARLGDPTNVTGLVLNFGYVRANGTYDEITVLGVPPQSWLSAPVAGFVDVPSDARLGTIRVYAFAAGAGSYTLLVSEPMVTSAAAGQTVHPPYSPGPVVVEPINAGGPLLVGTLPPSKADSGLINANVPLGNVNRVPFTRREGGRGWMAVGDLAPPTSLIVFDGRYFIVAEPNFTAANQNVFLVNTPRIPVRPGERLSVSAAIQAFSLPGGFDPNYWHLYWEYYTALDGGTQDGITTIAQGFTGISENVRHAAFSTVPATSRAAQLVLRYESDGAGPVRMAVLEPMVTSASADQAVHPPYSPGPNAVDGALPNNLITVDGSGNLNGIGTVGVPVDNRILPLGNANRVPFSRMEGDSGWLIQTNPSGLAITQQFAAFEGMRFYKLAITATASNQVVSIGSFPSGGVNFRVTGGERLSVQSRVEFVGAGAAGGTWNLTLWVILANGSQVSGGSVSGGDLRSIGAGFVSFFATMPANAVGARLELYGFSGGAGNFDLVISEPMVTSAAAGQTVHPPFTPGPVVVEPIDAGGPLFVGTLPVSKADNGLRNSNISVDGSGLLQGIGPGAGTPVNNALVPVGSNVVVNSEFTRGRFGWRWRGGGFNNDWGVNLTGSPNWFGQRNVMWATVPGVYASGANSDLSPDALWAGAPTANAPLLAMPVVSGDRLFASVLAARHRCTFQLWILQFDAAFNLVSADEAIGGTLNGAANGDPANFTRVTRFSVAVSTARWAIPMMRMIGTGEADPYIFFTEPMLAKVPANQTAIPPYVPGRADPNADVTAQEQISFSEPAPFQIQADSAGVTTTNLATQTRSITLRRGGVAQTSGVTVGTPTASPSPAIAVASATVSAGVVTVTLSAANASGSVTIPVIFGGVTYPVTIPVIRTIAAPVAGGSGSQPFSDQTWSNINSTTYTAVTDAGSTVLSSSGGQLQFSYSAQYEGGTAQCKAQYSSDGSTWFDVTGSEVTGTPPITIPGEESPGDISLSHVTQSGLAGSTLYHVRLVARRTAGSTTLSWLAPTFTARQP